jgi:phenylacetate-CoA ligase
MHRVRLSAFAFDAADMDAYWRRCLRFGPDYFYGYVSMLEAFARHVAERGWDGRRLALKVIVTTSEVLTAPQRQLLRDTFGCPVQNEYGCGEVGPIAYECPAGSLHLMDHLHVELVDSRNRPVSAGETGEVAVTDLYNRAMPLVRYRLGDSAVAGAPCNCGRGLPVLQTVWGRSYDFVESPDGRRFHGEFFMYLFEQMRQQGIGVRQFQVRQQAPDALSVALVCAEAPSEAQTAQIVNTVRDHLGPVRVQVTRVEAIARTRSGKTAVIVNEWRNGAAA